MKPRVKIAEAAAPDGTRLELVEHDGDYYIHADGLVLMSTRMVHSEEELARLGCADLAPGARVLIGGLGCGYTLRATLDRLPRGGKAVQAELVPEIVEWNRGPLAPFADRPLDDERTELVVDDVAAVIRRAKGEYAAILLDVDNGPSAVVTNTNAWLYSNPGLRAIRRALAKRGRLAIWSVGEERPFLDRLDRHGFDGQVHPVRSRGGGKGLHYFVIVGEKRGN